VRPDFDPLPRAADRVVLRRLAPSDLVRFQRYRTDPDVGRFQGWSAMSDAEAVAFLGAMSVSPFCPPGEWFQVAIAEPRAGILIGDIGIRVSQAQHEAEIGFTLDPAFQGRGLATEAVGSAIDLLFATTPVARVVAVTDTRNRASIRLLERVGLQRVRTRNAVVHGEACAEHVYSLARAR